MIKNLFFLFVSVLYGLIVSEVVWRFVDSRSTSLIIGSVVPLLTLVLIYKRKILIIFLELFILTLIGFYIQQITYANLACNMSFTTDSTNIFNDYLGFTILLPLFGLLFHSFRIKNKVLIVFISIIMAIIVHITNFYLYQYFGGNMEQLFNLVFIFWIPIAILLGSIYAFFFIKFYVEENILKP